jgi:hypothetical protein
MKHIIRNGFKNKKPLIVVTAFLATSIGVVNSQIISCPVLTCGSSESFDMDQCFQHDDQHPVQTIKTFGCEGYLESTLEGTPLC